MNFQYFSPTKIISGFKLIQKIGAISAKYGSRILLVTGKNSIYRNNNIEIISESLKKEKLQYDIYSDISGEPDIEVVDNGIFLCKKHKCNSVIAIGGGSVIDTGKAISSVVTNGGSVLEYLEGIGTDKKLINNPLPLIAVPTTAGTGTEVTKNGVITSKEHSVKKSIRSNLLFPKIALLDPDLTISLPQRQTAFSGMDAICQLIESYVSKNDNPISDNLALYGLKIAGHSILQAYKDGENKTARENMMTAATFSGITLTNSGLGAVHGIASPFGALSGISHGEICAVFLPDIMTENTKFNIKKYSDIGEILTGKEYKTEKQAADAGIEYIQMLLYKMNIQPDFKRHNLNKTIVENTVKSLSPNSMKNNPGKIPEARLYKLLDNII